MANPLLSNDQQAIVVFWLGKSLDYRLRLALGFGAILAGIGVQYYWFGGWYAVLGGLLLCLGGNLLLLVRGVDNRVQFDAYSPTAAWEPVDEHTLWEAKDLAQRMKTWDRSILDATSARGAFLFILLFLILLGMLIAGGIRGDGALPVLALDAAVLLFPHLLTGKTTLIGRPKLVTKIDVMTTLLRHVAAQIEPHQIHYLMLLKGHNDKVPEDVKFRITLKDQPPDFLGLYGQIVLNRGVYPYFYVVLVARRGYGLQEVAKRFHPPKGLVKEFSMEPDVEVCVIRQATTKTSGYYTREVTVQTIFLEGLRMAETSQEVIENARAAHSQPLATVFEDLFEDNRHEWYEGQGDTYRVNVENGHYLLDHLRDAGAWASWKRVAFDPQQEVVIEAAFNKVSGSHTQGYGLMWGSSGADYYVFCLSGNGSYLVGKVLNEKWAETLIDWTPSSLIQQDYAANTLTIKGHGMGIELAINGDYAADFDVPESPGSTIGFVVYHQMQVWVEHVVVKGTSSEK